MGLLRDGRDHCRYCGYTQGSEDLQLRKPRACDAVLEADRGALTPLPVMGSEETYGLRQARKSSLFFKRVSEEISCLLQL